jgi:hypothetical protein|tara:strand:- start:54 stop:506 length:453 start_codon:yes stop_codon:yes gene_type:complete
MIGKTFLLVNGSITMKMEHIGPETGPDFEIRDAAGNITNGSDDLLVVVDMMDKTNRYNSYYIGIKIQINGEEEINCEGNYACGFEFLEIFDDQSLTALESILIFEVGEDLCSGGPEDTCEVTVRVMYYKEKGNEEKSQVFAVLTINAISE